MFYTYVYFDPERNVPMYVGKGSEARVNFHLTRATNIRLKNRISALKAAGIAPIITKVLMKDEASALAEEVRLIKLYGRLDLGTGTLYNATDGGEGKSGWIPSTATKMKISVANSNPSEQTRAKQSSWIRDQSLRKKISEKRKLSEALMTEEKKASRARKLSKECLSLETRALMSEKAKARPALECPHCGQIGKAPGIRRHHFERCKTLNTQY